MTTAIKLAGLGILYKCCQCTWRGHRFGTKSLKGSFVNSKAGLAGGWLQAGDVVKKVEGDFFNWASPENVSRLAPPKKRPDCRRLYSFLLGSKTPYCHWIYGKLNQIYEKLRSDSFEVPQTQLNLREAFKNVLAEFVR